MPDESPHKSSIAIVDDHPIMRQGLAQLINQEQDLAVCGEAESADEAMNIVAQLRPNLVLVDISLKGKSGLALIKDLRIQFPQTLVLVLSMHDESIWAERSLRAGACGYVMKQEKPRELVSKIRQALSGEVCLSEAMSERLVQTAARRRGGEPVKTIQTLGDRELEVFQLIGEGMTTRQIAVMLHISQKTVEAHREHIKQKLRLTSGAELLRHAFLHAFGDS